MTAREKLAVAAAMLRTALEALEAAQEAMDAAPGASSGPEGRISTAEAARLSGNQQSTVLAWIKDGRLPAVKPQGSRGYRIRPSDLEALLSGGSGQQAGATPHSVPLDLAQERGRRLAADLKGGG